MICPNCHKESKITEHNFGALYTCSFCQAVYCINFEGLPEFGEISNEVPVDDPTNLPQENPTEPLPEPEMPDNFTEVQYADAPPANPFILEVPPEVEAAVAVPVQAKQPAKNNPSDSFTNIAQEISDFGNTDSQLASMNYDLQVTGIDNQQTKSLFKEAIEDSKFAWDAFEIMKSIKNGRVEITKMSPAKAYLLAKRLQFLDLEKKWKQNVLS